MELTLKNVYHCKDGRWRAYCVDENGKPHIVSYPRIVMMEKLGRSLQPNEDVHHVDENPSNNAFMNLEVEEHGKHQAMHSIKYFPTVERCVICGKEFEMSGRQWQELFSALRRGRNRTLTCSKECSGKASSGKYTFLYDASKRFDEYQYMLSLGEQEQIRRNPYAEWVLNGGT